MILLSPQQVPRADDTFEGFAKANLRTLLLTATLLCDSGAAAEDLVQDALIRAYMKWDKVMRAENPTAYVRRIMLNLFIDRGRGLASRLQAQATSLDPDQPDARDRIEQADNKQAIRDGLSQLPHRQRAVLVMSYFMDLGNDEIAEALRIRCSTVRALKTKGLRSLHELVADQFPNT